MSLDAERLRLAPLPDASWRRPIGKLVGTTARQFLALALLVALAMTWGTPAAADAAAVTEAGSGGTTLRVAVHLALPTFDPHQHSSSAASSLLNNIYDSLLTRDADGKLAAGLAADWQQVDDRRWRFQLRQGIKFHDGRALTAEDVVASLERAAHHPKTRIANRVVSVAGAQALDDLSVEVEMATPDPLFLGRLATVQIVPKDAPETIVHPIGTGPYRWISGELSGPIVLDAVASTTPIQRIQIHVIEDTSLRAQALLDGEVDLVHALLPEHVERIEERSDLWVDSRLGVRIFYIAMRQDPPLDDPRVRRAIDLALDREAIVEDVLRFHGRAAGQMATPGTVGFDERVEPTGRDVEAARHLLTAAGYPDGLIVPFQYPINQEPLAQELAAQLAEAGIRLEMRQQAASGYYATVTRDLPLTFFAGLGNTMMDAQLNYESTVHTQTEDQSYGRLNRSQVSDAEIDLLIERAGTTMDPEARSRIFSRLAQVVGEVRPLLPLYYAMNLWGARRDLEWQPRIDNYLDFQSMRWSDPASD